MIIVSASRRTDLTAFFPEYLSSALKNEFAEPVSPYGVKYRVNLNPSNVHSIVLWSKNFKNLLKNRYNLKEQLKKFKNPFFLFTITGFGGTIIEPLTPNFKEALKQLKELVYDYGAERVVVRFDPIMFYYEGEKLISNISYFEEIVGYSSHLGIKKVIFSFVQYYSRVKKRLKNLKINYYDPDENEKINIANNLSLLTKSNNIELYSCSQDFLLKAKGVKKSKCIDSEYLSKIHPDKIKMEYKKDKGQREECGCSTSKDIGSYTMSCSKPCFYCYANLKTKL